MPHEPTKVYLLSTGDYSDYTVLGVYSSREKAEAEKAFFERPYEVSWMEGMKQDAAEVKEFELDRRILVEWLYEHPWNGPPKE